MVRNLLFALLCTACSAEKQQGSESHVAMATGDEAFDTGSWGDAGSEDSEPSVSPSAWTLSGELYVEAGALLPERSLLTAEVTDGLGLVICEQTAGLTSTLRIADLPDDDLDVWWSVEIESRDMTTCDVAGVAGPIPERLRLGIGPLHPEVEAVLDSDAGEAPPDQVDVKSVFVSFGEGADVWVFGLASVKPEPGAETDGADAPHHGVTDGLWRFRAVYPFSY